MSKEPVNVKIKERSFAAHEQLPFDAVRKGTGTSPDVLLTHKLNEISKLLWVHEEADEETKNARILRALELYESLEPADGADGMLATQMVGTHDAALECLKRAALPNQTFAGRDMALKHAHKLMTLYRTGAYRGRAA